MTEATLDLPVAVAKSGDAESLRALIRDGARRQRDIEVAAACGAGHGERCPERENRRTGDRLRQWGEQDRETVR